MANPLDLVFGQKPQVAKPTKTNLAQTQSAAIGENVTSFPQTAQLGNLYSSYLQSSIEAQLPDYKATLAEGSTTSKDILTQADSLINGQIPQDVQDQIQRSDAYTSLMAGTAGSGMSKSLTARDLGLTSLDLMKEGTSMAVAGGNAAQNWAKMAGSTTYDPAAMFVTPAQQTAVTQNNNALMQAYQQFKFNVAAAPDPGAAGVSNTIMGVVSAYLGAAGGGGMRGGASGGSGGAGGMVQGGQTPYSNFGIDPNMPAFGSDYPGGTDPNNELYSGYVDSPTTNVDLSSLGYSTGG